MNKKVVIIGNNSGGMYDFRHELIEELIRRGCSITVLTPFDTKVDELRDIGVELIDTPLNRRGINPKEDFTLLCLYRKLLKKLQPDLVITYTIKPNIYGGYVCRRLSIPYAANITGLGTTFQKEGILKKIVVFLYKIGLKSAQTVFFENDENRQIFLDTKIVNNERTCLLNGAGVNLERYSLIDYPSGDKTKFLFIGRVMKEKGIDELFAAMKKLVEEGVDCSLDILGGYEEDYKAVIQKYEREGWLHYHGYQLDVRPFIAKIHCFVLPSWHEGMANTNLECAASGRPVITSNIHGCLEAVENGVTGFLCKRKDEVDLYQMMMNFTKLSYEERREMGIAGRHRMERLFDKKIVIKQTLERLEE